MFSSSWGAVAQAILNGIGGTGIAAIFIVAFVVEGIWVVFHPGPKSYGTLFGTVVIAIMVASSSWLINLIPGLQ